MTHSNEKIQKVLARCGFGSRRQIEGWLRAGRITVNDHIAQLGDRITLSDQVTIDNQPVSLIQPIKTRVLCYNKPLGEVCTRHDPEGRPTVFAALPVLKQGRWIAIGRLDINTSGLLLFTNDGELANKLMHPSYGIQRYYAVRVMGKVTDQMLAQLQKGVMLDDGMARFSRVKRQPVRNKQGINQWFHASLSEGRNREVRRLWESQGVTVSRLLRIGYGHIRLPRDLLPGKTIELTQQQSKSLINMCSNQKSS